MALSFAGCAIVGSAPLLAPPTWTRFRAYELHAQRYRPRRRDVHDLQRVHSVIKFDLRVSTVRASGFFGAGNTTTTTTIINTTTYTTTSTTAINTTTDITTTVITTTTTIMTNISTTITVSSSKGSLSHRGVTCGGHCWRIQALIRSSTNTVIGFVCDAAVFRITRLHA